MIRRGFTYNTTDLVDSPKPWGPREVTFHEDVIDTLVKGTVAGVKDSDNGHRHFDLFNAYGNRLVSIYGGAGGDDGYVDFINTSGVRTMVSAIVDTGGHFNVVAASSTLFEVNAESGNFHIDCEVPLLVHDSLILDVGTFIGCTTDTDMIGLTANKVTVASDLDVGSDTVRQLAKVYGNLQISTKVSESATSIAFYNESDLTASFLTFGSSLLLTTESGKDLTFAAERVSMNGNVNTISNIVEYADNAAAVSGGLTTGDLYRTGDILKIVHA
jgi:hypothetical protein